MARPDIPAGDERARVNQIIDRAKEGGGRRALAIDVVAAEEPADLRDVARDKEPSIWSTVKRFEAEFLRIVGERTTDPKQAFSAFKASFETYQKSLAIISRETAPNDWAMVCAEMGYTIVAALPLLDGNNRVSFGRNAVSLFGLARPYFAAGGFGQDLEKLDAALKIAQGAADQQKN